MSCKVDIKNFLSYLPMRRERELSKTGMKSGMNLLELSVVMASFLLMLTLTLIGATALKAGTERSGVVPQEERAPKRVHMPAQIAERAGDGHGVARMVLV